MLLFVYGTLRRGQPAEHLMRGAEFMGPAKIRGQVVQTGGYLGLVEGEDWVDGELYLVPEEMFRQLDEYEGPGYDRRLSSLIRDTGEECAAWVYWIS